MHAVAGGLAAAKVVSVAAKAGALAARAAPKLERAAAAAGTVARHRADAVVIGRTMARVTDRAEQLGANVYKGLRSFPEIEARSGSFVANVRGVLHNARWAISTRATRTTVFDIGRGTAAHMGANYGIERMLFAGYGKRVRLY